MKKSKTVKAWALYDAVGLLEVAVPGLDHKPSLTFTDENGCVVRRDAKLVRVEIRPLPAKRRKARRKTK